MSRAHPPAVLPLGKSIIPNDLGLRTDRIILPPHISNSLPEELRTAYTNLCHEAEKALLYFVSFNGQRELRYIALCPPDDAMRATDHVNAMECLISWSSAFQSNSIPPQKHLRYEIAGLHISQKAYEQWAQSYSHNLRQYMDAQYLRYLASEKAFIEEIDIASVKGTLEDDTFYALVTFLQEFLAEMEKLETLVNSLPLPSYETLLHEVFYAITECVEDASLLWERYRQQYESLADYVKPFVS